LPNKLAPSSSLLSYKAYVAVYEFGRMGQFVTSFSNHTYTGIPIGVYGLWSFNASHSPHCWTTYGRLRDSRKSRHKIV